MSRIPAYVAAIIIASCHIVFAGNWGHWRGPTGNGAALEGQPPTEWSSTKNVKWKIAIPGRGSSSPVVWDNKVFITTAVPVDSNNRNGKLAFEILCLNRANGDIVWKKTAVEAKPHEGTHQTNGYASASPCTDGQHVYAHFGSRGLYCYTMDGEFVWKRDDLGSMKIRNSFGEGSSPTIADDKILIPWDHEGGSALYALNKLTGQTIWKTDRDETTNWATPLVVDNNGKKQVVTNGQKFARGYDLETGKELWRCGGQTERPVASPVAEKGLVFVGSGHKGSFLGAFHLDGKGDIKGTKNVAWTIDRDTPDIGSPLLSSGRIYFHKGKSGQLSCVDAATGKPFYMGNRIPGLDTIYASPVAAGGHVYLSSRNGKISVIKDSSELNIVATNDMGETVDATPAPVDNELFIRGENHLFCIAESR